MNLTKKGRKVLEEQCEEAFHPVDFAELTKLSAATGFPKNAQRLYRGLLILSNIMCPSNSTILNDLQLLLIYEKTKDESDKTMRSTYHIGNFGEKCKQLLSIYLVNQGLIR